MMEKRKAVVVEDDSTSTTTAGLTGCKKPRLAAGKEPVAVAAVEMSDVYRSGDFQGRIADCWRNNERMQNEEETGAVLYSRPYQLCVLPDFITSSSTSSSGGGGGGGGFLQQLRGEVSRLKFAEKNNDLYQFHQSDDLKRFKSPCIAAFRRILEDQCLPWLQLVTGIELTSQIDMTCSKYEFTDYLLCHDDQLESRRVAFILYLTEEWTSIDGGNLEIFDTDERGHPQDVVLSVSPVWNNFIFFEVSPSSFHQVGEVLDSLKTRLSINGWFHGPSVTRTPPKPLPPPLMLPPTLADLSILSEWVSEMYLDIGTQSQVQAQFEEESQIELTDFLLDEKYEELCRELRKQEWKWTVVGPPNKRCVKLAEEESLSEVTAAMMRLLGSEPFCRLLSHLTGLDLALNLIRLDSQDHGNNDDADDDDDDGEGPCSSSSLSRVQNGGEATADGGQQSNSTSPAEVHGELQHWRPGNYSLVSDQDPSVGTTELHLLLHFCCEGWTEDCGGMRVYVAKDEDEELLSVSPSPNALSLVFCDKETISFTKYINHRTSSTTTDSSSSSSSSSESSFFCASFTYRETL